LKEKTSGQQIPKGFFLDYYNNDFLIIPTNERIDVNDLKPIEEIRDDEIDPESKKLRNWCKIHKIPSEDSRILVDNKILIEHFDFLTPEMLQNLKISIRGQLALQQAKAQNESSMNFWKN